MDIQIKISTTGLGDNTPKENERYADAVFLAVETAYPNANVDVRLTDEYQSECLVDGDGDGSGEVSLDIDCICEEIWDQANY